MDTTRTHVTYFDVEVVDAHLRPAFQALETDYLERKPFISQKSQLAIERRLDVLRSAWALLLEPVPGPFE